MEEQLVETEDGPGRQAISSSHAQMKICTVLHKILTPSGLGLAPMPSLLSQGCSILFRIIDENKDRVPEEV